MISLEETELKEKGELVTSRKVLFKEFLQESEKSITKALSSSSLSD